MGEGQFAVVNEYNLQHMYNSMVDNAFQAAGRQFHLRILPLFVLSGLSFGNSLHCQLSTELMTLSP